MLCRWRDVARMRHHSCSVGGRAGLRQRC